MTKDRDAATLAAVLCAELQRDPEVQIAPYEVADHVVRLRALAAAIRRTTMAEFNGLLPAETMAKRLRRLFKEADDVAARRWSSPTVAR